MKNLYALVLLTVSLGEAGWNLRKRDRRPLHREFISAMRRRPFRFVMADHTRPHVSSLQALIGSIAPLPMIRLRLAPSGLNGS